MVGKAVDYAIHPPDDVDLDLDVVAVDGILAKKKGRSYSVRRFYSTYGPKVAHLQVAPFFGAPLEEVCSLQVTCAPSDEYERQSQLLLDRVSKSTNSTDIGLLVLDVVRHGDSVIAPAVLSWVVEQPRGGNAGAALMLLSDLRCSGVAASVIPLIDEDSKKVGNAARMYLSQLVHIYEYESVQPSLSSSASAREWFKTRMRSIEARLDGRARGGLTIRR